jgi:hypothetical protein
MQLTLLSVRMTIVGVRVRENTGANQEMRMKKTLVVGIGQGWQHVQ